MYEEILAIPTLTDEQKSFIAKRIEITQKKNANRTENAKPTKVQLENEGIKTTILSALTTEPMPIGEIIKSNAELAGYSNQKISALLTQLLKANAVVRTEVKGKAHYALPAVED
jgi:Flp pilus assembly protein CpaB